MAGELTTAQIANAAVTPAKVATPNTEGLHSYRVARAVWDFAVDGGGAPGAIGLGVTLPQYARIVGGTLMVVTTCQSATDAGTGAISVEGANDIVNAVAIGVGTPWDAGPQAIIPKANTPETTGISCSAAREITFTTAVEAFTAGKFVLHLLYVMDEAP